MEDTRGRKVSVILLIILLAVCLGVIIFQYIENISLHNNLNKVYVENQDEELTNNANVTVLGNDCSLAKDVYNWFDSSIHGDTLQNQNKVFGGFYFYGFDTSVTQSTYSNSQKQSMAYNAIGNEFDNILDNQTEMYLIFKSAMDTSIKKVFGNDTAYTPSSFTLVGSQKMDYDSNKSQYSYKSGLGGMYPYVLHGIYKVEEYKDSYFVYEKAIYVSNDSKNKYLNLKDGSKKVMTNDLSINTNLSFYCNNDSETQKVISTYWNEAYEYKHTFKKQTDGTYFWYKSEVNK